MDWIKGDNDNYKDTYVFTTMMEKFETEKEAKSYALRLLIHYLGDVHQPLHCMDRVNDEYPEGDRGGNEVPIPYHYRADNLHALWDAVIYKFHKSIKLVSF